MKNLLSLFAALCPGIVCAMDASTVPEGVSSSDWDGLRAAHATAVHAPQRQADGDLVARNPGQQWETEFDGKGFTVTPDHRGWSWGLDLTAYGDRSLGAGMSLRHEGGKVTCQRDENLTEWFINDSRGLEQGWDIQRRPGRSDHAAPLLLHLSVRGDVKPQVSASGDSVSFHQEDGASALSYGGLKAWDADGKTLPVRFEQAVGDGLRISVDDLAARYPITIDPVAMQTYLAPSNGDQSDDFSHAVAISGDTVVMGAPGEDSAATGVNGDEASNAATDSGAAYIFVRNGSAWTQQAYLKASNTGAGDSFGCAVAISGDTVAIAARSEDSEATGVNGDQSGNAAANSGAVYVFTRSGTTWTQQAYLKGANTGADDNFGASVGIVNDTVVVGASEEDSNATGVNGNATDESAPGSGAVYVFTRSGTTWTQQAYLKASNPGPGDKFGNAVAMSGETLVIGAVGEGSNATGVNGNQADNNAGGSGAAYVFTRNGTTWSQQAYLKASNTQFGDAFGYAVTISGDLVVVGAPYEDSSSRTINSGQNNNDVEAAGAAYVFTRSGTTWSQEAYLKALNTGGWDPSNVTYDQFGCAVALSGDTLVVGAFYDASPDSNPDGTGDPGAGAVHSFTRRGTNWFQYGYLKATHRYRYNYTNFGRAVAISGGTALIGAPQHHITQAPFPTAGVAYIFDVTLAPVITLAQPNQYGQQVGIPGGTRSFDSVSMEGGAKDLTFWVRNDGELDLILSGSPVIALSGSSDFTVVEAPTPPSDTIFSYKQARSFKVRFAPTGEGLRSTTLSIASNDPKTPLFTLNLEGSGLSFTTDTDGDGLSDAAEYNLSALNFNWRVSQSALVATYYEDLNRGGLYAATQVHALRPVHSVAKDPVSGQAKLTTHWKKSANFATFFDFPAPAGSSVSVNPSGGIDFEFPSSDGAAFFRVDHP
ncbi:FG-GAP repeat protein [Luteolibacter luteus]|uniref:Choice-of-anchor D domain-containing protein n=1 Tax=Luteolibacter luteus TaxID=2728835 RepID=A0A858RE20_9BACT|nr:hypothetical protein [Luteolibacter luteus]QJE94659.1 hypothetical protein HHL09_02300 [Luteolibacter luteus]